MGFVAGDRVRETTTSTGTGDKVLAGAATAFQAFSSIPGIADQDSLFYTVAHQTLSEWETGIGRWNSGANSITPLQVIESSNADAAVAFSAGTKDIFNSLAAQSSTPMPNNYPKGSVIVPAGHTLYVSGIHETAIGMTTEIGAAATMEIG